MQRYEATRRAQARRSNIRLAAIAGSVLLSVLLLVFLSGSLEPAVGRSAPSEGGVGQHIPDGTVLPQRNRPPSSGPHYAAPATYGVSSEPVAPGNWVHSLEHGAIVVLFKCEGEDQCAATARQLGDQVYAQAKDGRFGERKMVITPYQDMDFPIIAVAWDHVLELESIDANQILKFYDRYVDGGPENVR